MTDATDSTPARARERVIQRSTEDPDFRRRLLEDARAAVEEEIGVRLPEEIEFRAVEETDRVVYLVLPSRTEPAPESGELSDRELESVAGGWDITAYDVCDTGHHSCDPNDSTCDYSACG